MKLTVINAKTSTLVNLMAFKTVIRQTQKIFQKLKNVKRMRLRKTFGRRSHNFSWGQNEVAGGKSSIIPRKIPKTIHSLKNLNHMNQMS